MKTYDSIGLMSGTSLDGVDLVYVSISTGEKYTYKIVHAKTYTYSVFWRNTLQQSFSKSREALESLDKVYGAFLAALILEFKAEKGIEKVDFIASHGHTVFHNPKEKKTLQIGCGQEISRLTNTTVVYDFRTQDVAFGGQGAPLVPIGDELLFSNYDFCLNLGGFANVSYQEDGVRKAFDVCPVNIVLNHYTNKIGKLYDDSGQLAASGKVNEALLNRLNAASFFTLAPPKSLGYEFVSTQVIPKIDAQEIEIADILRTYVEHIAQKIAEVFSQKPAPTILITGGGVYNDFLLRRIQEISKIDIQKPAKELIEFKEALIFSLLGLLKLENKRNCLKSVTGAKKDHCSGRIA
jgi:anhydro-N-acetylmuramic acid kinase